MKTLLHLLICSSLLGLSQKTYAQLTFSLQYTSGTTSLTCTNSVVTVSAISNTTPGPVTYSVLPPLISFTGSVFNFTVPGTFTISGSIPGGNVYTQSLTIHQNTVAPTSTISPILSLISCTNPAVPTVTALGFPSYNIQHTFYWSTGGQFVSNATAAIVPPGPGTHTYVLTNLLNGCTSMQTFTVGATSGFPTIQLTSPIQNFTIGCSPNHTADIVINGITNPPGGVVAYTIFPLSYTGLYNTSFNTNYTFNMPGNYMAVVRDIVSGCESKSPFTITQYTSGPSVAISMPTQTLSCLNPSVILTGSSSIPNSTFNWISINGGHTFTSSGQTYTVTASANSSQSLTGTYTLQVISNVNSCMAQSIIPVFQNIYLPNALILPPGIGNTVAINCATPAVVLANASTSGIQSPPFPNPVQQIVSTAWFGPSPQASLALSSTYTAAVPGTYTLHVLDLNNGCTNSTVFTVFDHSYVPFLNVNQSFSIACPPVGATTIFATYMGTLPCQYIWSGPSGTFPPGVVTGSGNISLPATAPGFYTLTVTHTLSGCDTSVVVPVYACVGLNENKQELLRLNLVPNPVQSAFLVDAEERYYPFTLLIYNSLLQIVATVEVQEKEKPVSIDLPPGMYHVSFKQNGRIFASSKLIKE